MTIDIDGLPPGLQFAYISMTKNSIFFKEMGRDKKFFLSFCEEIWNSMEMTDLKYLKSVLEEKMEKDIRPHVDNYVKQMKK